VATVIVWRRSKVFTEPARVATRERAAVVHGGGVYKIFFVTVYFEVLFTIRLYT